MCVCVLCVCVAWHGTVSGVGSSSGDIRYVILVSLQDSVWVKIRKIEALRYDIPENKDFCLATRTFGHFCAGSPQAKKMTLETVKQHYFKQNFKYRH